MTEKRQGDGFLCSYHELPGVIEKAERDKDEILKELAVFFTGNIEIRFTPEKNVMGWNVRAELTVNGETVRVYQSPELCFIELQMLMLGRLLKERNK